MRHGYSSHALLEFGVGSRLRQFGWQRRRAAQHVQRAFSRKGFEDRERVRRALPQESLVEGMQCLRWEEVTEVKVEEAGRQRRGPAAWDEVA